MSAFGNSPLVLGGNSLSVASGTSPVGTLGITDDQVAVGAATANTIEGSANFTFGLANGLRLSSSVTGGLQLYNTADQTTNYERLEAVWSGNIGIIRAAKGGTGVSRQVRLLSGDAVGFSALGPTNSSQALVLLTTSSQAGHVGFGVSGFISTATSGSIIGLQVIPTYNQASGTAANTDLLINRTETAVGSGNQRLLDLQVGGVSRFLVDNNGNAVLTTLFSAARVQATASVGITSKSRLTSASDGVMMVSNNGETDFSRLQFGGTTSSFPALKRSSATLQVRLADDSANATLTAATYIGDVQPLSGAGAANVTQLTTALTSTGGSDAITLADGTNGQLKTIVHDVDGGGAILTPATKTGFTTITFTNAGETATLQFFTTRGWMILALNGAVAA